MPVISPVTLTISPTLNPAMVSIYVHYDVAGTDHDIITKQHFHELCQLIGDDTPGDGTDDIIRIPGPYPWVYEGITVFSGNTYSRGPSFFLPANLLDEDSAPIFAKDEIRARVTLTPIPTSRESDVVRVGDLVNDPDPDG